MRPPTTPVPLSVYDLAVNGVASINRTDPDAHSRAAFHQATIACWIVRDVLAYGGSSRGPGHGLLNARIGPRTVAGYWDPSLWSRNLTDSTYSVTSSGATLRTRL